MRNNVLKNKRQLLASGRISVLSSSLTFFLQIYDQLCNHQRSYWFRDSWFHYSTSFSYNLPQKYFLVFIKSHLWVTIIPFCGLCIPPCSCVVTSHLPFIPFKTFIIVSQFVCIHKIRTNISMNVGTKRKRNTITQWKKKWKVRRKRNSKIRINWKWRWIEWSKSGIERKM